MMRRLRPDPDSTCYRCRGSADARCDRCGRSWCADHESHSRLCGRCHTEYVHRHDERADQHARSAKLSLPAALAVPVTGFAAAKLWIHASGRPSPADFLFMWIPLAVAAGLVYVLLASLREDARAARRCEQFIVERPRRRRRLTEQ